MNIVRKLFALLCLLPLLAVPFAHAQKGTVYKAKTTTKGGGIQPDSELPYSYANIYILRVGSSPNSQPTSMIDCSLVGASGYNVYQDSNSNCYVQSNSSGGFNLAGTYYQDCNSDSDILYLEVRGGTVGSSTNSAFMLMSVPPSAYNCGYLYNNAPTVEISDFTNAAAAFVAGSFANYSNSPLDGISTYSGSYTALGVAFDAVNNLVPISTGFYGGSDSNVQKQLNTIADVFASCEDSSGPSSPGCSYLFSDTSQGNFTSTHAPNNTWQAVASMAQDPANNVTNQYNLISSTPPWQPTLTSAPATWASFVSGAPKITGLSASSGQKGHSITIYGSNLVDTSGSCTFPTVVVDAQVATPTGSCSSSGSSLTITLPGHAGYGVIGVYLDGNFSNFVAFQTTN